MSTRQSVKSFKRSLRAVVLLGILVSGCITIFALPAYSADSEVEYTYIPDDKVGDISVYLDELRFLMASWKDVNLLHATFPRKRCGRWWPSSLNVDIPVRVTRKRDGVEYLWSGSFNQSNPREKRYLPVKSDYLHLQCDFKQMTKAEIEKDRITVTTTLKFTNAPTGHWGHPNQRVQKNIVFTPLLFPGRETNRGRVKELRVLGTKCVVIDKDGKAETVAYPEEVNRKLWLNKKPRSLIFDLDTLGKIRYNFSFSDPDISLVFYDHPIAGMIVVPSEKKFKDGIYECSMKMEILVGDAVTDEPGVSPPSRLPLDKYFDVRIESEKPSYRFFVEDPLKFHIAVDGLKSDATRNLSVAARVLDYENREIHKQRLHLSLPDEADKPLMLSIPSTGKGAFILDVKLLENNEVVGCKAQRFCVIDHPVEYPPEKSFFGCTSGWFSHGGIMKDPRLISRVRDTLSLLHDLGIKKLRWGEHWTISWDQVEKERGKYVFPEKLYKLEVAKEIGMDCFLYGGTFCSPDCGAWVGSPVPEWAKEEEKKDRAKFFKAYENYCYEVAKRYEGLINTFELENESNLMTYENSSERKEHIKSRVEWLSTAYKGIKRGNPNALVLGGTLGCTNIVYIDWLDDLLKYAEAKGVKLFDIIGPHSPLRPTTPPPEDHLENLRSLRVLADRYGLILWDGEFGYSQGPFHDLYPNYRFLKKEKDYSSYAMRNYLLEKSYGVEHLNICHACEDEPPRDISCYAYRVCQAGRFYGRGGFIKPWAVAHATMAQILEGSDFDQRIDLKFPDAWCMVYKRGSQTMAAIWMKEGKAKLNVRLPKGVKRWNIVGAVEKVRGRKAFTITEEPFYLIADGKAGARLVKALGDSVLESGKVIVIGDSRFASGNRVLEVDVRNCWSVPLVVERAKAEYEDGKVVVEKVTIPGGKVTPIRFDLKKQLNPNGIWVEITMNVKGKKFTKEVFAAYMPATVKKAVADGYLVAIRAGGVVRIDGDLSEWKRAVPIELNSKSQVIYDYLLVEDLAGWVGPEDLSGTGYVMWDDRNFYFACKVTDDIYKNPYSGKKMWKTSTWKADSLQLSFDPLMTGKLIDHYYTDGHQEINMSLTSEGPVYLGRAFGTKYADRIKRDIEGQIPGAKVAVKKWDKGLIYEFSMPLGELYPLKVKPGAITRFNFIINDDDGRGRDMWIGVTPGIGEKKRPALFRKLIFLE